MKTFFFSSLTAVTILFTACSDNSSKTGEKAINNKDSVLTSADVNTTESQSSAMTQDIVTGYLNLKNALTEDNGKEAAEAANTITSSLEKLNTEALTPEQKQTYDDVKDNLKEHAEHIASNSKNISHQREHFEMISEDMVDLVKSTGSVQTLYKDYCPMYNNNKGAFWLSETKEIKNPYLGKKMPTCGEIKEEIKPKG